MTSLLRDEPSNPTERPLSSGAAFGSETDGERVATFIGTSSNQASSTSQARDFTLYQSRLFTRSVENKLDTKLSNSKKNL